MATFVGTAGNDIINGTSLADVLSGLDGNDRLSGGPGGDTAHGGNGADYVIGGSGADSLYGDAGNDTLNGGSSADYVSGGTGADVLEGGAGFDRLAGGSGNDYLTDGVGGAEAFGGTGNDGFVLTSGRAHGGDNNDFFTLDFVNGTHTVSWAGDAGADTFHADFSTSDGHVSHVTVADFSKAQGDHLLLSANDFPTGDFIEQEPLLAALDSNHDLKLSALDQQVTAGTDGLTLHWHEDQVTLAHFASIDLSMFG